MLLGKNEFIENILKVKSNMDSGMFYGIQMGAIQALNSSSDWFSKLNNIYKKRRLLVWELALKLGCSFNKDSSGMFVWAKLPSGHNSEEFSDNLLYKKHIFVTPGTIFGTNGNGYIRFSLCNKENIINNAIKRISWRMLL